MRDKLSQILFLAGCDAGVVSHCVKTADIASKYRGASVDSSLVEEGAMLHDLGRSKTHSIHHAMVGAELSRALCLSPEVTEIIRCHTGAGLSEDDCTLLGLPLANCVPRTLEGKIVAHADNLAKGSREILIEERMMLASGLSKRSKRNIWRLAMEIELLR